MDVINSIRKFNEGRNKKLLKSKYQHMRQDAFGFFRSTAHLFYEALPKDSFLHNSPNVWICGDLHFENFGSFKGDNGLVYFDINDFDEALLAPALLDVSRFLVSLLIICDQLKIKVPDAINLCKLFIDHYSRILAYGSSRVLEKETAKGLIRKTLTNLQKRKSFIKKFTIKSKGSRKFDFEHKKLNIVSEKQEENIIELIREWNEREDTGNHFQIIDWAYHIKGKGSLGHDRYLLLAQRKDAKSYYLVDLKKATPSCALNYVHVPQRSWKNEAERIVEIQKRVQGTPPALLHSIDVGENSYVLSEYQPSEDKVDYTDCKGRWSRLEEVVHSMAQVTAWDQLQSGGRQGSAIADELIAFGSNLTFKEELLIFVENYYNVVQNDYRLFCEAYDAKSL